MLLVGLADEWAVFLPSGALESFRADLGLSYAQAGSVLAAILPGALLGGVFSAAADRFSRRAIAAGGAYGFALSLAMFAAGGSFAVLVAAAVVMGAASTAMVDAAEVAWVDLVGSDLRVYLARSNLFATVGDLLGPALIAGTTAVGLSWRAAFGALALLMACYGIALAAAPLPPPGNGAGSEDEPSDASGAGGLVAVLRDPAVWVVGLIGMLLVPFDEPLVGFTIALLERERDASTTVATVVALVGVSGGLLSYTVLARRFQTVGDRRLLVGGAAVMTAGALAIAAVPAVVVVATGAFVASVGLNLAWLAVHHRTLTVRPRQVGMTKAVLGAIEVTGFWIPAAIGAVADAAGLVIALATYGLLGAALLVLAWRSRDDGGE